MVELESTRAESWIGAVRDLVRGGGDHHGGIKRRDSVDYDGVKKFQEPQTKKEGCVVFR